MPSILEPFVLKLRRLMEQSVHSMADLPAWYSEARSLEDDLEALSTNPAITEDEWHGLWHYLADADTRLKSPEYAKMQNEFVAGLIAKLERPTQ
jgi:hypothetical protein